MFKRKYEQVSSLGPEKEGHLYQLTKQAFQDGFTKDTIRQALLNTQQQLHPKPVMDELSKTRSADGYTALQLAIKGVLRGKDRQADSYLRGLLDIGVDMYHASKVSNTDESGTI